MNNFSIAVFRISAWLSAAFFCLNGGIVLYDGAMHSERLQTQYQIGTLIVGLTFGLLGVAIFGLERSLMKIYSFQADHKGPEGVRELVMPWRAVHLVLGIVLFVTFVFMETALIAIIERLRQGVSVFG